VTLILSIFHSIALLVLVLQEVAMSAHSNEQQHRRLFFTSKHYRTRFRAGGREFEAEIRTPDLSEAPASMWADWGPMYSATLGEHDAVHVTYRCPSTGEEVARRFRPPQITIHSTADAGRREQLPFRIEVTDAARGLRLAAWMDHEGEVVETGVRWLHPGLSVASLLFGDESVRLHDGSASTPFSRAG
jgi:hypothetical protein